VPPFAGVAVKVTGVPAQMVVAEATTFTLTGRLFVTVIATTFEVAGLPEAQPTFEVISQVTASALLNVLLAKVALFDPTETPLTNHAYTGVVPPLTAVAVKVTGVPSQIVPAGEAAMLTLTGCSGATSITNVFDGAGLLIAQVAFEFTTQTTV